MNTRQMQALTPKRKKKELGRLFRFHGAALEQSVEALDSRRPKIAAGVLDSLAETRRDIDSLVKLNKRPTSSASVDFKIKELLKKQRKYGAAFEDAVRAGLIAQARTVMGWLNNIDKELSALI